MLVSAHAMSISDHPRLFQLGAEAMKDGRVEAARAHFAAALEADPEHEATRTICQRFAALEVVDDTIPQGLHEEVHTIGCNGAASLKILSDPSSAHRCGGLWASAPVLIDWITATPERRGYFEGRRVLEFGSGLGYVRSCTRITRAYCLCAFGAFCSNWEGSSSSHAHALPL